MESKHNTTRRYRTSEQVNQYLQEVIQEAMEINIPISRKISPEVQINGRAKSRFGCCKKEHSLSGINFTIEINAMLLDCKPRSIKALLAHEVLHTCKNCQNHGSIWRGYAKKMAVTYGYHIKGTTTFEAFGLKPPEKRANEKAQLAPYKIICQNCGNIIYRQRRSKLVTGTMRYRCRCGGKLICESRKVAEAEAEG